MDYINYTKQSPMMGYIGLGGGAASLGRYQSAGGGGGGAGAATRGFYAGLYPPIAGVANIDTIVIATTADATDFGD